MFKKIILLFTLISSSQIAFAQKLSLKDFKISIGAEYLSNLSKRGATLYDSYQIIPIFAVDIFTPNLQLIGSSLNYKYKISDSILYRTRINFNATGDQPIYETNDLPSPSKNKYQTTTEWDNYLEFGLLGHGEFTIYLSKDLSAHKGLYLEGKVRAVLSSIKFKKANWEPALFGTIGGGNKKHNEYLYGNGGTGSLSNYSLGVSLSLPPRIDHFFPIFEASYYELLGQNRNSPLVKSNKNGFKIIALFAFNIY